MDYSEFLDLKAQYAKDSGFNPKFMPDFLFDFQKALVEWAVMKGRAALFCDCGLGKTPFMGVGSEVYGSLINNRKAIGIELKPSYFKQAIKNVESAFTVKPKQEGLFT
jgi:hypothetical protein